MIWVDLSIEIVYQQVNSLGKRKIRLHPLSSVSQLPTSISVLTYILHSGDVYSRTTIKL